MYTRSYKNGSGRRPDIPYKYDGTAIGNVPVSGTTEENTEAGLRRISAIPETETVPDNSDISPDSADFTETAAGPDQADAGDSAEAEAASADVASADAGELNMEERIIRYGDALPRYPLYKKRENISDDSAPIYGTRPRYPATGPRGRVRGGSIPDGYGSPMAEVPDLSAHKASDTAKPAAAHVHTPDTYMSYVDDLIIAILVLLLLSREDS